MIYRFIFKGFPLSEKYTLKDTENFFNPAVFTYDNMMFLYVEAKNPVINPDDVIEADMKKFPDGKNWEEMSEIFHYSVPQSDEDWERKQQKTPSLQINYVRPGKISSYIYYHFQYQEEYPCDGDKYGIIFHSGNLLVMYLEYPCELAKPYKGMLSTKNSPKDDDWQELMNTHFDPDFGGWTPTKLVK